VRCCQKADEAEDPQRRLFFAKKNEDLFAALSGGAASVGGGTAWLWSRPDAFETVDVLFVDEAAQMALANVLAVSQAAKAVVLIGDPQQLDQPMQGSHPEGTDVSALDHQADRRIGPLLSPGRAQRQPELLARGGAGGRRSRAGDPRRQRDLGRSRRARENNHARRHHHHHALQRTGLRDSAVPTGRSRGHRRQISRPGSADRNLLDGDVKPRGCAARDGVSLQPQPAQRRDLACQMHIDPRRLAADLRSGMPHAAADSVGQRLLPLSRDGKMHIVRLKISGFRGVRSADIALGRHAVLVGPNNSCKTTIIEALALLFGRDRLVRRLTEHDFHGSAPDEPARILCIATVTGFTPNDPHHHSSWFSPERGVEKWFDPITKTLSAAPAAQHTELAVQIGFVARFDLDELEAETLRFFVDDEATLGDPFAEDAHLRTIHTKALQELGFFLVPASRTWDRWISFSSELFRRVVATRGDMPAQAVRAERARLWTPPEGTRLEDQAGLSEIVNSVNDELGALMASAPRLQLRLTSTDSDSLLESVVPHFVQGTGPTLPSQRHGTGLVSLQSLLLLMQLAKRARKRVNPLCWPSKNPNCISSLRSRSAWSTVSTRCATRLS
jgi:Protein of unknown function (DUF2813)